MAACAQGAAPTWIKVTAFVVLVLLALTLVYQFLVRDMMRPAAKEGYADGGHQLIYMYIEGCMWCDKFSPEWEKFLKMQAVGLKAAHVSCYKIDGKAKDARVADLKVEGYPTIILIPAGSTALDAIHFQDGARSAATLTKFLQDNVPDFKPA